MTIKATPIRIPDLPVATSAGGTDWVLIYQDGTTKKISVSTLVSVPAVTWGSITGKPTTVGGFGITDAYTKAEVDTALSGKAASSHTHSAATTSVAGFMSAADKTKLDGVAAGATNYTHPANHPASIITQDASNRFVTDAEKATWNAKQAALGYTPENTANKGAANGYASLDAGGKVPTTQLPSFVDDVLEFANLAAFPGTGETGKIYVALDTNKTYRWSGTVYVYITSGAVDSVAGKTGVVTLVKADVGLGNVDNTSDANKPVSTATQTALNAKESTIAAGTTAQYWRGDKTWADLFADVRAATLTGLSTATNAVITAADTVLGALGKLQAQITANLGTLTSHTGNTSNPHSVTKAQVGLGSVPNVDATNAANISAGTLPAARLPALTGDATSTAGTAALTLANSGVTAGTYNDVATQVRPYTVDAKGRITAVGAAVTITPAWGSVTGKPTTVSGYGITDAYTKAQVDSALATYTGAATITTVGTLNGLTFNGSLYRVGGTSIAYWLQQDGTGRSHWYWGTAGGAAPTYATAGEDAGNIRISISNSGAGANFTFRSASGVGKAAGDAVNWTDVLYADLLSFSYKGNTVWRADNDGTGSGLDADLLDGTHKDTLEACLRANVAITGGGTISVSASTEVKWTHRFILIANGRGAHFSTNGYFDIDMPAVGTVITGVGGASNVTVTAGGIQLYSWQALYYIVPQGASNAFIASNLRVAHYSASLTIPHDWVLLCVCNGDMGRWYFPGGVRLKVGESIDVTAFDARNADLLDGQQGSYYQNASNLNAGTIPAARLPAASWTDPGAMSAADKQKLDGFATGQPGSATWFTASGTWTRPSLALFTFAVVELWGAGGGGGGGQRYYNADRRSGGTGGGGGAYRRMQFLLADLPSSVTVTIGAGGAGGAGSASLGANPTNGQDGGATTFGSILQAYGGKGGRAVPAGDTLTRTGGLGAGVTQPDTSTEPAAWGTGGTGGQVTPSSNSNDVGAPSGAAGAGGGAGGGLSPANATITGKAGGANSAAKTGGAGGATQGAAGGNGALFGEGGGGGGWGLTANAGNGGNGNVAGGGGGGGASTDTYLPGNGGNGGPGRCVVYVW